MKVRIEPWIDGQRQVVADQDILSGEIVIQEEPLVSSDFSPLKSTWNIFFKLLEDRETLKEYASWSPICPNDIAIIPGELDAIEKFAKAIDAPPDMSDIFISIFRSIIANSIVSLGVDGLYKTLSKVNHSCIPNCYLNGPGILIAQEDIKKDSPIGYNYAGCGVVNGKDIINFLDLSCDARRALLSTQGFTCVCERCKKESQTL